MTIELSRPVADQPRVIAQLESLAGDHPHYRDRLMAYRDEIAALFSCSQFLATYVLNHPESLLDERAGALAFLHEGLSFERLHAELEERFTACTSTEDGMREVRRFRKDKQLVITLRDILHRADLQTIMLELTMLADVVAQRSLGFLDQRLQQRYGAPENNGVVMIGMGKLGAEELNFSSDIDPIFVYREEGETSGISTTPGVVRNRISALEYYVKLVEEFSRFLSLNTADGFAFRVDLRLRPQGTRGSLALSLNGHEEYYESWGQLWERAALLRARPVAGDMALGADFLEAVKPFIYRKYLDHDAIEEIRRMKSQVEQLKPGTPSRDIKRGFGGIREIEFFIQIFQLMYGGREPLLRERSTLKALHRILQKGLIGHDDSHQLSENYLYLRTLEHRIQQVNDLQTHSLPASERDLGFLALKMGYPDRTTFLADLQKRRLRVRGIYDSLFQQTPEGAAPACSGETLLCSRFWDLDTPDRSELTAALTEHGVQNPDRALYHLTQIRNTIYSFQTLKGRKLLETIIPQFIESALRTDNPDWAIMQLVDFSRLLATNESYLEPILKNRSLVTVVTSIFAQSDYLAKLIMSNPEYMGSLVEGEIRWRVRSEIVHELDVLSDRKEVIHAVRLLRRCEEIRLGTRFLNRLINVIQLTHSLTTIAETVVGKLLRFVSGEAPDNDLLILGYGKLGGREISFNSDLDIVFATPGPPQAHHFRQAENFLKSAMSHTREGVAYSIDTRLRPDGNKGPLVTSLDALREYYFGNAQSWELQALLKARPVTNIGTPDMRRSVIAMKNRILAERGPSVVLDDVLHMRHRIEKERAKDDPAAGVCDIKLGSGGMNEIEFMVQYLQLHHCAEYPGLLVQNTIDAIRRLRNYGIVDAPAAARLHDAYLFFRVVETMLRLRNETILRRDSGAEARIARLMQVTPERFVESLQEKRAWVCAFRERLA